MKKPKKPLSYDEIDCKLKIPDLQVKYIKHFTIMKPFCVQHKSFGKESIIN